MRSLLDILLVTVAILAAAVYVYRRLKPGKSAACGGCDNCGPTDAKAGTATQPGTGGEVRIPLSSIQRRIR